MSEEVKKSFSFGFAKKSSVKKLEDSKLRDDSTKDKHEETDFIIEVDRTEIKGTKKKEVKEELIIPYLPNTYKKKIEPVVKSEHEALLEKPDEELTEEEKATKELLKETKAWQEEQDKEKKADGVSPRGEKSKSSKSSSDGSPDIGELDVRDREELVVTSPEVVPRRRRLTSESDISKIGQDDIIVYDPVLHLQLDQPVTFLLRSNDVLHNFTVPQFRVKMDFVPGQVSIYLGRAHGRGKLRFAV